MIAPEKRTLDLFASYDTAGFERWLRVGLEGCLLEGKGVWAFDHVAVFLRPSPYLEQDIKAIYDMFSAAQQASFRQAVADLLAKLEAVPRNVPVFEALLTLAAALPAHEVLPVLSVRVNGGAFGPAVGQDGERLIARVHETVLELAAPTREALTALRALIDSRQFDVAYAGLTLLALCRVEPGRFAFHMERMRGHLYKMFKVYRLTDEDMSRVAIQVAEKVGPAVLAEQIQNLSVCNTQNLQEISDAWFIRGLIWSEWMRYTSSECCITRLSLPMVADRVLLVMDAVDFGEASPTVWRGGDRTEFRIVEHTQGRGSYTVRFKGGSFSPGGASPERKATSGNKKRRQRFAGRVDISYWGC